MPKTATTSFDLKNKKARWHYTISDTLEAGLVLHGTEIKALRAHRASIEASYVRVLHGEGYLIGAHFQVADSDPSRSIKLLLHKAELARLIGTSERRGMTILPLHLYQKRGRAKLLIGVGRGKKLHEQREVLKQRTEEKEARRAIKVRV